MLSYSYNFRKVSQHPYTSIFIKCIILFSTLFYVHYSLSQNSHTFGQILAQIHEKFTEENLTYIVLPLILVPVNWGLEAKKWQLLAQKVEKISFFHAFKGTLTGLTLGFVTPHTIGDYAGRIWQLDSENRYYALASIWLGRLSQLFITLSAGSIALIYFLYPSSSLKILFIYIFLTCSIHIIFFLLFFYRAWLIKKLSNMPYIQPFANYLQILNEYSSLEIAILLIYAGLRYMVFSLQFYLILLLFNISLTPVSMFTGIALIFLSKSVMPSFSFLADLGIRETAALYFFGAYGASAAQIVAASLSLWLLNILFPALLGALLVLKLKITS